MSEMVERVARDLAALITEPGMHPESVMAHCRVLARTAIKAMSQPTGSMVEAAYEDHDTKSAAEDSNKDFAAGCWQAMIDRALKD